MIALFHQLPEVSRILEAHMDVAEQRWRAGEFVQFVPGSPSGSVVEDNDATLIPSHNTSLSLEDTLTDENISKVVSIVEDDSGIGNDITLSDSAANDKSVDENNKSLNNDSLNEDDTPRNNPKDDSKGDTLDDSNENDVESIHNNADAFGSGDATFSNYKAYEKTKSPTDIDVNESIEELDDSKIFESVLSDDIENYINDVSTDDVFEDCVDDIAVVEENDKGSNDGQFDRVDENYSLEMKLALGIEDGKM